MDSKTQQIMNFLDEGLEDFQNENIKSEAFELKQLTVELIQLPPIVLSTDQQLRFKEMIDKDRTQNQHPSVRFRSIIVPAMALAALVLLFFVISGVFDTKLVDEYTDLEKNTDKLNYVYALNNKKLSIAEIDDLSFLLNKETHPNLKVAILDVLSTYPDAHQNPEGLIKDLTGSRFPTVQMAILDLLESLDYTEYKDELYSFSRNDDLDKTVGQKIASLLSTN